MRILARHCWVDGATITESISKEGKVRRFTATIRGFRNWRIYQGPDPKVPKNIEKIREIRDRIDSGNHKRRLQDGGVCIKNAGMLWSVTPPPHADTDLQADSRHGTSRKPALPNQPRLGPAND